MPPGRHPVVFATLQREDAPAEAPAEYPGSIHGDGSCPTWIGRDAAGEVVCFVTDALLLQPDGDEG